MQNLKSLYAEALKTRIPLEHFIDLGSGRGKACLYAYKKFRFQSVQGVEYSEKLFLDAHQNREKISNPEGLNFYHQEASVFKLPASNVLLFMFNPFDDYVLNSFLKNNLEHLFNHNALIAYVNDVQRKCLLRTGFETIFRNQDKNISLFQFDKR